MVLLVANRFDKSTAEIVRWLSHYNQRYVWIDEISILRDFETSIDFSEIRVDNRLFSLNTIKSVWWRRPFIFHKTEIHHVLLNALEEDVIELLRSELYTVIENLLLAIRNRKILLLGNDFLSGTNKLDELRIAQESGFLIPPTIITTKKQSLVDFHDKHGDCISKSLYNSRVLHVKAHKYEMHTHEITKKSLDDIPVSFAPSLIQKKIDKHFEIRIFYIDGKLYTAAIFSQINVSTTIDWRKGQKENPSRFFPMKVDNTTQRKIIHFMKAMNLRIGSLDFILDNHDMLYFLEVNHEGQFDMLVSLCNYDIYKYIAEMLISSN